MLSMLEIWILELAPRDWPSQNLPIFYNEVPTCYLKFTPFPRQRKSKRKPIRPMSCALIRTLILCLACPANIFKFSKMIHTKGQCHQGGREYMEDFLQVSFDQDPEDSFFALFDSNRG